MADEIKCVWDLHTPHSGEVKMIALFRGQITIPVCESHLEQHRIILALHQAGYAVEEMMAQTAQWRKDEFDTLVKNGMIDPSKVEL